jgi:hypothetical protein
MTTDRQHLYHHFNNTFNNMSESCAASLAALKAFQDTVDSSARVLSNGVLNVGAQDVANLRAGVQAAVDGNLLERRMSSTTSSE